MEDILLKLANIGGTIATVAIFIWYLYQKGRQDQNTYDRFNTTINNHLDHAQSLQKETNAVNSELAKRLQQLTDVIHFLGNKGSKTKRG